MRALTAFVLLLLLGVAVAGNPSPAVNRRVINLPGRTDTLPFSNAVLAGDTLYLSGTIGIDPATGRPPANIEDEARLVLDNLKRVLEAAGMSMEDLVSVTVYCPDLSLYDRFNAVYRTYFARELPARAFIGSGPLLRGGHFEVQGIAVRR
ncbi:MAG: RidA family protein [Acidobacteriia bacterium]|jgi:2-iminobutanoate/2-iminopropanoate deaminase|nr:RidA family protein [Terriglobia bacterium]